MGEKGKFEVVIAVQGQWMGVPELKKRMNRELIPEELTARVLSIAGMKR